MSSLGYFWPLKDIFKDIMKDLKTLKQLAKDDQKHIKDAAEELKKHLKAL